MRQGKSAAPAVKDTSGGGSALVRTENRLKRQWGLVMSEVGWPNQSENKGICLQRAETQGLLGPVRVILRGFRESRREGVRSCNDCVQVCSGAKRSVARAQFPRAYERGRLYGYDPGRAGGPTMAARRAQLRISSQVHGSTFLQ